MKQQPTIQRAPAHYRAERAEALSTCALGDILLIYHRPSGQTHMVISPVPEIMDALGARGAATAHEVHCRLSRRFDLGAGPEAIASIEAHLENLVALGLARRG